MTRRPLSDLLVLGPSPTEQCPTCALLCPYPQIVWCICMNNQSCTLLFLCGFLRFIWFILRLNAPCKRSLHRGTMNEGIIFIGEKNMPSGPIFSCRLETSSLSEQCIYSCAHHASPPRARDASPRARDSRFMSVAFIYCRCQ